MTLKLIGAAIILIGFIYFILVRAISTKNYKRKSLYMFIAGMVIVLFLVGGIVYDKLANKPLYPNGKYDLAYFAFLIVASVFMLFFTIFYFVKGCTMRQRFKYGFGYKEVKVKQTPTVKEKKGYVYIIFKYNNNYLLKKEINKDNVAEYSSLTVKFTHNDFFHDDVIRHTIDDMNLNVEHYSLVGTATKKDKKDDVYYCYVVDLNEKNDSLNDYEEFDSYQILNINIKDMDKEILFTSIIQDDFKIEL